VKGTFITWYPSCRRSDSIANALGTSSHLIQYRTFKQPATAAIRYAVQALRTCLVLIRERPRVMFVASPPVVAPLVVYVVAAILRVRFVIDAHTGVFDDPRWTWLRFLSRFLSRRALVTIVTNPVLQRHVEGWGARACIIADVPVTFPQVSADLGPGFHAVVINTFSQDEPLEAVLEAAAGCPEVQFHVTGNPRHARRRLPTAVPANVRLTGWLTETDYAALLRAADLVIALTTSDHTMQRGAYEALAVGKPLVTSNWPLLRATFSRGTIHVDNSAQQLLLAIVRARSEAECLARDMQTLRIERLREFQCRLHTLLSILNTPIGTTP
jgi:glycosyltransferase involved in cell wall biosynthesis